MRSWRRKRKPNQLFVYDNAIQWFDFPKGPHFNKLPFHLVCKYWYNQCRKISLWTTITWNRGQRTLGHLLQLIKYQVRQCAHLKCLKIPPNACIELFKRELPRTNILGGIIMFHEMLTHSKLWFSIPAKDVELALTLCEHKICYTLDESFEQHEKDIQFLTKLKSLHRGRYSRSVRVYDKIMKTPDRPSIRKCPLQDYRTSKMLKQPIKTKPRPPKGRMNHHKKIKKFKGLQKRFKMFSLA
ncbi:hypothetical protein ACJMK2_009803 [Sinanodonta woodiana]|uniref:Uncharacterized protein n=1 Tax=Sinanodonta woodiana TaxID=1069815 RepID=A0ABD3VDC9_SINWO